MNGVDVCLDNVEPPPWLPEAEPFVLKVLDALGRDDWDLSLVFCGNREIKAINKRFRRIDEPTDVLSFQFGEGNGEIYISLDALAENAAAFNVAQGEELRRLIIHGILHIDGMDHATNGADEPMLIKQEALLAELAPVAIL
jgi:probable rRNA maturation factor